MASGIPSSRAQISVTIAASSSVTVKSGLTRRARSSNNSTASPLSDSEGTRQVTSPANPIGSRLVAINVRPGHDRRSASMSSALASSRCSQLSSTISRLTAADGSNDGVHRRSARLVRKPERAGNGDSYEFDVGDRREVDVPHPVAELTRNLNRQSCLSRTTRSGEGHQSVVGQQPTHLGDLSFTTDETRQLRWKTLGGLRFRCSQRRKVIAKVRMAQLDNPFGPGQVAQRMSAEIIQPRIRRVGGRAPSTPLHPTAASGRRGPDPEAGRCG